MRILNSRFSKIAAIIGFAWIVSAAAGTANAGNYGVGIYLGNGSGIYFSGNGGHYNNRRYHNPGYYNPYYQPGYNRHHNRYNKNYRAKQRRQVCGPRRAVKKAYRLGLNNPQVQRIKERRIIVAGYQYGYRTKMVFKRYSNCRLIKTVSFNR